MTPREAQIERIAELYRELDRPLESRASRILRAVLTALTIGIAYAIYSPIGRRLPDQVNFFVHAALTVGAVALVSNYWPRFRNLSFISRVFVGAFVLAVMIATSLIVKKAVQPAKTRHEIEVREQRKSRPGQTVKRDIPLSETFRAMKRGDLYVITHGELLTEGTNWKILTESGAYKKLTHAEAVDACKTLGEGFTIPTSEDYAFLTPKPTFPRAITFWVSQPGGSVQLEAGSSAKITAHIQSQGTESTRQVMCWKSGAKP